MSSAKPPKGSLARFFADLAVKENLAKWQDEEQRDGLIDGSDLFPSDKARLKEAVRTKDFRAVQAEIESEAAASGAEIWLIIWLH